MDVPFIPQTLDGLQTRLKNVKLPMTAFCFYEDLILLENSSSFEASTQRKLWINAKALNHFMREIMTYFRLNCFEVPESLRK